MYCAVNCIENPYVANYIKKRKQIEDEQSTNEREETSQYPPIISYDELGNEEELSIQPIPSIKKVEPTHNVKRKRRSNKGKKVSLPNDVAPTTHCDDDNCYTVGAIHIFNDESDYAYDMKRTKLGEAMFDEDDIFENIFAEINVCPKVGMLRLMKMIFLASQVLICKVVIMIACLVPMMIILMKVGLEECQL